MGRRAMMAWAMLFGLAACDGGSKAADAQETVDDQGEACIVNVDTAPYGTGVTVQTDAPVTVRAAFDACAPCGDDLQSTCEITQSGTTLTVTASSSWTPIEGDCPADCRAWFAECSSGPLPAGTYTP